MVKCCVSGGFDVLKWLLCWAGGVRRGFSPGSSGSLKAPSCEKRGVFMELGGFFSGVVK